MLDASTIADVATFGIRPITRTEYDRLIELGWFQNERVELLQGVLVTMSPHGAPHADVIRRLTQFFVRAVADKALVQIQSPIAIGNHSEPEPDIAIVEIDDYSTQHPTTASLVIEVADSSLRKDTTIKPSLYASASVDEYWVVNLPEQTVDVYRAPEDAKYKEVSRHHRGDTLSLVRFPALVIPVDMILPKTIPAA